MKQKLLILSLFLANTIYFSQDLISGGSNSWMFLTPDDGRTTLFIAPYITNDWQWGLATQFFNNGDVAISGNVGIGTTSPSDKLTVAGSAQIESNILLGHTGNTNRITLREVSQTLTIAGSDQTTFDTYSNGWLERMRIANNGNVGIGTSQTHIKTYRCRKHKFS